MRNPTWTIAITLFIQLPSLAQTPSDTICLLQLNDVYEIAAINQGTVGGMARVATLIKLHKARYQTFAVVAGDFLSPSVIGTTKVEGQKVYGRHMVDMLNKAGINMVTFGNHEFDIPEKDLQQRINESQFAWVSSNVLHRDSSGTVSAFYKTKPVSAIIPASFLIPSLHNQFTIGIVTATIPSNPQPWVVYNDYLTSIKKALKEVRKSSDVVVGLTHLTLAQDKIVLRKTKHIRLIMGGHEHTNNYVNIRKAAVAKADANAQTIYRHLVFRSGRRGKIKIISELINVDTSVVPDPAVALAVKEWEDKAYAAFRSIGLEPDAIVYQPHEPLDGREESMRHKQTNLGNLIAQSLLAASSKADAAIFNSGSVRIDDMIEGIVSQLDIIRMLPFGGKLCDVQMSGQLLNELLAGNNDRQGLGGYLQLSPNLQFDETRWLLKGSAIIPSKTYLIVVPEYLLTGLDKGLEFLKEGNPGIKSVRRFTSTGDVRSDIRLAVVRYLVSLPLE